MDEVYIRARDGSQTTHPGTAGASKSRRYGRIAGIAALAAALALTAVPVPASAKDGSGRKRGPRYVLPVAERWARKHKLNDRHHDYPAWDLAVPKRTAVRAVTGGRVVGVTRWGGCGNGVIVRGHDGYRYTYCHAAKIVTKRRRRVQAGDKILLSGSTGHSTGPHLHLQIQGPRGRLFCPQPLLAKWARGIQASPRTSSSRGCAYSPDLAIYRRKPGPARGPSRGNHGPKSRSHRHDERGRDHGRAARDRKSKNKNKSKSKARSRNGSDRKGDGRHKGRKGSGKDRRGDRKDRSTKRRARKAARGRERHRHRHRHRKARDRRPQRGRAARHARARAAARRARERARIERVETQQRRAELALGRRVRPLI